MKKLTWVLTLCLTLVIAFASCEEQGGSSNDDQNPTQHTHAFGEWETTTNPTCTEKGEKARYCSCGEKQTDVVVEKGHNFVDGVCEICDERKAQDNIHEHIPAEAVEENFVDATCYSIGKKDIVVYCATDNCNIEIYRKTEFIEIKPHTPSAPTEENRVEPTFEKDGSYEVVVYCSVSECHTELSREKVLLDMLEHHPGATVIENIVASTCTSEGSYDEVVYCLDTNCGYKELSRKTVVTQKLSHTHGAAVRENETAATCTKAGSYEEVVYCSSCSAEISRTSGITPTIAHNYINDVCTECQAPRVSEGLTFTSNGDGTCYVSGIGTCTDAEIIIPTHAPNGDTVVAIGHEYLETGFYGCTSITSVKIPNTVTAIRWCAFEFCTNLVSVEIPDSVKEIYFCAFTGCENLTDIVIPDSVTSFGGASFASCKKLKSIEIPNGVTTIYYSMFQDCEELTSIIIPSTITSIGIYAFGNCSSLTNIEFEGTVEQWTSINKEDTWDYNATNYSIYCTDGFITSDGDITYYESTTSQGLDFALNGDGQSYCVTGIGTCIDTYVIIPNEHNGLPVTSMLVSAYMGYQTTRIRIPDSLLYIEDEEWIHTIFYGLNSLEYIDVDTNNPNFKSVDGVLFNKDCTKLIRYPQGKRDKSYIISNKITSFSEGAFYGCAYLENMIFEDGINVIAGIWHSDSIVSITIPTTIKELPNDGIFGWCSKLSKIIYKGTVKEWGDIEKSNEWYSYCAAKVVCTDGEITGNGTITYY